MTRSKKSRKPGAGSIGALKDDKKKILAPVPKKPKNKSGKAAGNRQQEGLKKSKQANNHQQNKDPRIGNKTPIDLGKPVTTKTEQAKKPQQHTSPIAAVKVIETTEDNTLVFTQEIEAIEQDPRLLSIIDKQEQEIALTEAEVDLFNDLMERHEALREKLGWNDDEDDVESQEEQLTEDDLWNKFDNGDLSDYK